MIIKNTGHNLSENGTIIRALCTGTLRPRSYLIDSLLPHEQTDSSRVEELKSILLSDGRFIYPIVIDDRTMVILDGHTRCEALRQLGYSRVMAVAINYLSENILVQGWYFGKIPKKRVFKCAYDGRLMPPKSTRHLIMLPNGIFPIGSICRPIDIALKVLT